MKLVELFACAGGIAVGAHQTGFETIWATDIDPVAASTFAHNFPNVNYVVDDIANVDLDNLPKFDGLAFGSPCNNFSIVGNRAGLDGKYGPLYTYGTKVLKIHQPKFFVFENVSGILSKGIEIVKQDMENAGYDLFQHHYKFEDYGIPQMRHRIIIVGFRKDLNIDFQHPMPTHENNPVTVAEACAGIPADSPNHEIPNCSPVIAERLQYIKPGENVWIADHRIPPHLKMNSKTKQSMIYRRMHPDRPAYTLTASGGGGTHGYHWEENRPLTNRERARIQTFPDDFAFTGSYEAVRRQIGMSVPPLGARLVFEAVRKALTADRKPSSISLFEEY